MPADNGPYVYAVTKAPVLETEESQVIDLNSRIQEMSDPDTKMINVFASYAVQTENWQKVHYRH